MEETAPSLNVQDCEQSAELHAKATACLKALLNGATPQELAAVASEQAIRWPDVQFRIADSQFCACPGDFECCEPTVLWSVADRADEGANKFQCGCDVDTLDTIVVSAAHVAAGLGNKEQLLFLLSCDCPVDAKSSQMSLTPLAVSALQGEEETMKLLLERGADVNSRCGRGQSVLLQAVASGNFECAKMLIHAGASVGFKDESCPDMTLVLTTMRFNTPGWTELMELCIEKGANINSTVPYFPLTHIVARGYVGMVRELLRLGVNPNAANMERDSPLVMAVLSNHRQLVEMLLEAGADPNATNSESYSGVHMAAWQGRLAILRLLLNAGGLLDERTADGNTPFALACHGGYSGTAMEFLQRSQSINVNNSDKDLDTPLLYCAYRGLSDVTRALVSRGAYVELGNRSGATALWYSLAFCRYDTALTLLELGSPVDCVTHGVDYRNPHNGANRMFPRPMGLLDLCLHGKAPLFTLVLVEAGLRPTAQIQYPDSDNEALADLRHALNTPMSLVWHAATCIRNLLPEGLMRESAVELLEVPRSLRDLLLLKHLRPMAQGLLGPALDQSDPASDSDSLDENEGENEDQ